MTARQDQARVDQFGRQMINVLNHAGVALMTSVGHRTGLFEVMARLPESSSEQIAAEAGLSERYVREWLGVMVTGGIVDYRPESGLYHLPAEHAQWLTRAAGSNNMATPMQWIAVLGQVEDQVVEAFRHGRGVPYAEYHRFHEVMAEESAQTVVLALVDHILPLVPGLVEQLDRGISVLDVGCGSGRAMTALAERYPRSQFSGFDTSQEAIAAASAEAVARGLTNVRFEPIDVAEVDASEAYDLIVAFDAIHDQARPNAVLRNIARALRPGGVFLMQDISGSSHLQADLEHPLGPILYTISCMHCMSVSLASGGPGLGAMWGKEKALAMLEDAGFKSVRVETLSHDMMNYYYVATREALRR